MTAEQTGTDASLNFAINAEGTNLFGPNIERKFGGEEGGQRVVRKPLWGRGKGVFLCLFRFRDTADIARPKAAAQCPFFC